MTKFTLLLQQASARMVTSRYHLFFAFFGGRFSLHFVNESLAVAGFLGHLWLEKRAEWRSRSVETSRNIKNFVIPAKAGTQSPVYSRTWNGLGPGLRRGDGVFRSSSRCGDVKNVNLEPSSRSTPALHCYSNRVAVDVEQPAVIKFPLGAYSSTVPVDSPSLP